MPLHEFHQNLGARFTSVNGAEAVADFGDALAEHTALTATAVVLDLSFRSRLCLLGADRVRFLHGQVTNDVKKLRVGEGCYAALVTAKGKMESDLNIFALQEELLLDSEPGLAQTVSQRLEKFIVADDVQVVDVSPHYGLLSVQGPKAEAVVRGLELFRKIPDAMSGENVSRSAEPTPSPSQEGSFDNRIMASSPPGRGQGWVRPATTPFRIVKVADATLGEIYLVIHPRLAGSAGILPASSSGQGYETRRDRKSVV